jgi:hypothetical protein
MRFTTPLLILAAAASLTSCGKINHMEAQTDHLSATTDHVSAKTDHLSDTTDHVAEKTDHVSDTTDHVAEKTDHLSDTTDHVDLTACTTLTLLRQGGSKDSRDTDLITIDKKSTSLVEKLELAAKYMQGFEYQVWSPACVSIASREILIEQAATEFLTMIQPRVKDRSKVTATSQTSEYQTLYAMAATLHRTNSLQVPLLKGSSEKPMTLEDVLVRGLQLDQAKNRGEITTPEYPSSATVVGKYEKDAQFILRLRANFLMAYAYAIADGDDFGNSPNFWKKAYRIKVQSSMIGGKLFKSKWTPNLNSRTATEIRERITTPLNLAVATRTSLKKLGIDPMTDHTMVKLWTDADFSSFDLQTMSKVGGEIAARAIAIQELIIARNHALNAAGN